MYRFPLIIIAFVSLFASNAYAQKVTDDGAKRLKSLFTEQIETQQNKEKKKGGDIQLDGEIIVEQADKYYAVTLPAMTTLFKDGSKREVGLIAINATPTENPDNWTMAISIPSPILVKNKDDKITKQIDIGSQNMGGLWNGSMDGFSKLSASYSNVKVINNFNNQTITIGGINLAINLTETTDQKWSGPTQLTLKNVNEQNANSKKMLQLAEAEFLIELDNFSPKKQIKALEKIANDQKREETNESVSGSVFQNLGDSFAIKANLKGISMTPETGQYDLINLESGMFAVSTTGLNTDKVQKAISLSYKGLDAKKASDNSDPLMPDHGTFNLTLQDIPLRSVIGLAEKVVPSTDVSNPSSRQVAAMQTMMTLPKLLADAGTILTINKTSYGNDIYTAALKGSLKANAASMFGATGDIFFSIKNINDVIKTLKEKNMKQSYITKLEATKEICAQKENGAEQQTVCHFRLDENAKLTVNDQDLSVFLDAMSGKKPETVTEAKPEDTTTAH